MGSNGNAPSPVQVLPPQSIEAEAAVLGAVLIDSGVLLMELAFIKPEHFFIVRHAWIWKAMLALQERHEPIDYLTVVAELEQMGRLIEVGGAAYVLGLVNRTPSALNAEGYGRIVERMAVRRRLIEAAGQIARIAHLEETDIEAVISQAEQALQAATGEYSVRERRSVEQICSQQFDSLTEIARNPAALSNVKTGFADIDRKLSGLLSGELVLVGGRPGMGKSGWLLDVAAHNMRRGEAVGIISLEMSEDALVRRLISRQGRIDNTRLRYGTLTEAEWKRYPVANQTVGEWPLAIDDTPSASPAYLKMIAQRWVYDRGIRLLLIDYLQLMSAPGFRKGDNRVAELTYISRQLKVIARELGIVIIAAAQLNRGVEGRQDKRPLLSDLRESGALEQDADVVAFLYRDEYYTDNALKRGRAEFIIRKAREAAIGTVPLAFEGQFTSFKDIYEDKEQAA